MEAKAFVERVLPHLPSSTPSRFTFKSWKQRGRPTAEGFGIMPLPGLVPEKLIDAVMDVDHYVGNVQHVSECRSILDDRFRPPGAVRLYQRVNIPVLGTLHQELVLHRLGEIRGYQIAAWELLKPETDRLDTRRGFRSEYNLGAWLAAPGVVGYALCSAPRKSDVGRLKFAALTRGADAAAGKVLKLAIEGMARWAMSR